MALLAAPGGHVHAPYVIGVLVHINIKKSSIIDSIKMQHEDICHYLLSIYISVVSAAKTG